MSQWEPLRKVDHGRSTPRMLNLLQGRLCLMIDFQKIDCSSRSTFGTLMVQTTNVGTLMSRSLPSGLGLGWGWVLGLGLGLYLPRKIHLTACLTFRHMWCFHCRPSVLVGLPHVRPLAVRLPTEFDLRGSIKWQSTFRHRSEPPHESQWV